MMYRRLLTFAICLGAAWLFYTQWIFPVQVSERETQAKIAELRMVIDSTTKELDGIQALKNRAAVGASDLGRLHRELHKGAVMAWFPVQVQQAFAQSGNPTSSVRLNATQPASGLPGCERGYWHVVAPFDPARRSIAAILAAVNEIERQEPFVRLFGFSVKSDPADAKVSVAEMSFAVLAEHIRTGAESPAR